ncbi:hypothetical protein ACFL1Z_03215 [Thermodesulfobacteriota bacterium]
MSKKKVPFYSQTAILDPYIHSPNPGADPDTLEILLEMLRTRQDLRDYFFRSGPHSAWASILWDHGFFSDSPSPQKTEKGYMFPYWDVQEYLISVASQVPDIVIKHVQSIHGHAWYISRAIEALCLIEADKAEGAVPKIIEWLQDSEIASAIASQTYDLIKHLAQSRKTTGAFDLFRQLTTPIPPPEVKKVGDFLVRAEAVSTFRAAYNEDKVLSEGLNLLVELNAEHTVHILQEHLCSAIRLEAEARNSPDFENVSWWRVAVEETGQDLDHDYKDKLLQALRDTLESWVRQGARAVEPLIQHYLKEKREIMRRLGLNILQRFPAEYKKNVVRELRKTENLDDIGIHHEFFILMKRGYPYLDTLDQKTLITAICNGPPLERAEQLAKWAKQEHGEDPNKYVQSHSKFWVRDRLWMIKDNLVGQPAQILDKLIAELGKPEHPAFTRWHSGAYWVRDVGPLADHELATKSADELFEFLKEWKPPSEKQFGPDRISYEGLANDVAKLVLANPQKYAKQLIAIGLLRSEFACALLEQFTKNEKASAVPWELCIDFCEKLLKNKSIRCGMNHRGGENWVWARKLIVNLFQEGISKPERAIPLEYLPRVRDILLMLVYDPDPEPESDDPKEGWFGYNDPSTVAINHVRPEALSSLIVYALYRARLIGTDEKEPSSEGPGPQRLEEVVRETLTKKLNKLEDPSWAVHSVYGRHLWMLYWLDQKWVKAHIDQIFPEEETEENTRFFAAAWDSFVIFNGYNTLMLDMLYPKYSKAIVNLSKGYVTETHLRPAESLAGHLIWHYLLSDKEIPTVLDERILLKKFFEIVKPEFRGTACWVLWKILKDNPSDSGSYWPKVRKLWEWRVQEASMANNSTDFDDEMGWLAHLPLKAPSSETITSLWPLLEGLLPHIARDTLGMGWRSVEEYLAREVESDPVKSIQFYYLMYSQVGKPPFLYRGDNARKIIETAAAHEKSRKKALSLIDLLGRQGIHQYKDIYDRYVG